MTITAEWKESYTYTIKFNGNGGVGSMSDLTVHNGESVDLSANVFVKTGYAFSGWKYGDKTFSDKETVVDVALKDEVATLTATWTANTITVKFDKGVVAVGSVTGNMSDQSFNYDESKALTKNSYTAVGYNFSGWKFSGNTYTDEQTVKNLTKGGTVTFTAVWTPYTYTVTMDTDEKTSGAEKSLSVSFEDEFSTLTDFKKGYDFTGWKFNGGVYSAFENATVRTYMKDNILPDRSIIALIAEWKAISYEVRFRKNGNSSMRVIRGVYDEEITVIELPDYMQETGMVFDYWQSGATKCNPGDKLKELDYSTDSFGNSVDFYCVLRPVKYTLKFDACGGTGEIADIDCEYDKTFMLPTSGFTKENNTLVGFEYNGELYNGYGAHNFSVTDGAVVTVKAAWSYNYAGTGNDDDPYIINCADAFTGLWTFSQISASYGFVNHAYAAYKITDNINLGGTTLRPLFNGIYASFYGKIDGGNFAVSNFNIDGNSFIGYNYGEIKNLFFDNVKVTAKTGAERAGVIAYENRGTISGCRVKNAEIDISAPGGYNLFGGISGYSDNEITFCSFEGKINVGKSYSTNVYGIGGSAAYCYADVEIIVDDHTGTLNVYAIGATAKNCAAVGKITVSAANELKIFEPSGNNCYYSDKMTATQITEGGSVALSIGDNATADATFKDETAFNQLIPELYLLNLYFDGSNYPTASNRVRTVEITEISTAEQLLALSGNSLTGSYRLACDIDLGGAEWKPSKLLGTFDGNGKTISNFKITKLTEGNAAFFSYNYGTIRALSISGLNINIDGMLRITCAGLVCYNFGDITHVSIGGAITAKTQSSETMAGGICAYNSGTIRSSVVNMSIVAEANKTVYAGGFVAIMLGGNISQCISRGNVNAYSSGNGLYVGAMVGSCSSNYNGNKYTATGCLSLCKVTADRKENTSYGKSVTDVASYSDDCYSVSTIDAAKFVEKLFLNERGFYAYEDEAKLSENYKYCWIIDGENLPCLYFEV